MTRLSKLFIAVALVALAAAVAAAQTALPTAQQFCDNQQELVSTFDPILQQLAAQMTLPYGQTQAQAAESMHFTLAMLIGSKCSYMRLGEAIAQLQADDTATKQAVAALATKPNGTFVASPSNDTLSTDGTFATQWTANLSTATTATLYAAGSATNPSSGNWYQTFTLYLNGKPVYTVKPGAAFSSGQTAGRPWWFEMHIAMLATGKNGSALITCAGSGAAAGNQFVNLTALPATVAIDTTAPNVFSVGMGSFGAKSTAQLSLMVGTVQ